MPRRPNAIKAVAVALLFGLSAPALAQETGETEARGLTSTNVEESLTQNPTQQGNRPPDTLDESEDPGLHELLAQVRRSPPTLDAEHFSPRPNAFASEPAKEMAPQQGEAISLFPENYVE